MELLSKAFGKIDIVAEQVLQFPEGLMGFETYREFALIEESAESPFKWLQSTVEQGLAFIVIQPELFLDDYKPLIPEDELSQIGLNSVDEALIFLIVTIPGNSPQDMTANLQGPILINKKKLIAGQLISRDDRHPVRYKMMAGKS